MNDYIPYNLITNPFIPVAHPHLIQDFRDRIQNYEHNLEFQRRTFMKNVLIQRPEPKQNDPDLSQEIRSHSAKIIQDIEIRELELQRLAPRRDPRINISIMRQRTTLELIYWRAFRINDLPPEILTIILRYVVWSTVDPALGVICRLWLTWVCRCWRTAAVADPILWNVIWFRDPPPHARSFNWFQRAGTAPLDIRIGKNITMMEDRPDPNEQDNRKLTAEKMELLLDRLFTKLSTIRSLIIIVETWPPALVILDKLRHFGRLGGVINIERFELHRAGTPYVWIGPGYEPHHHRNPITLFGGAPAPLLKYLCLNGIAIDWTSSPLANLTTLDLRRLALEVSPNLERLREILTNCPNLQRLSLDGAGAMWDPLAALGLGPVELPCLRRLVMGDFSMEYARYILAQISAPALRELTLMNMTGEDYSYFMESMTSKFKELRILSLYTFEVGDGPESRRIVAKFLDSLPLLSYLRVSQIRQSLLDSFLEDSQSRDDFLMDCHPAQQVLCRNLTVLEFQAVEMEAIVAFGKGRKDLNCPLRTIYVNPAWAPNITPEQQVNLRSICDSLRLVPPDGCTVEGIAYLQ